MKKFLYKLKIGEEARRDINKCDDELELPPLPSDCVDDDGDQVDDVPPDIRQADIPQAGPCGVFRRLDSQSSPGPRHPPQQVTSVKCDDRLEFPPLPSHCVDGDATAAATATATAACRTSHPARVLPPVVPAPVLRGILRDPASARPKGPLLFCPKIRTISIPRDERDEDSGAPVPERYVYEPGDPAYCVQEGDLPPPSPERVRMSAREAMEERLADLDCDDMELPADERQYQRMQDPSDCVQGGELEKVRMSAREAMEEMLAALDRDDMEFLADETQYQSKSATDLMALNVSDALDDGCLGDERSSPLGHVGCGVGMPPDRDGEDEGACQSGSQTPSKLQRQLERIIQEWDERCTSPEHEPDER